ncbi:MAG: DUF4838 domain-containing protein [Oscillospiraceae bacterium]|nr:DUF4838 domain-containing protein [Oscillospiraceae bacterium]
MKILTSRKGETAEYFTSELAKYIRHIIDCEIMPEVVFCEETPSLCEDAIVLAHLDELSLDTSDLKDSFVDDIIDIKIENGSGYIAGSNDRSILMGIYKYCVSAGCRFIRPGEGGEYIPYCNLKEHSFSYRKKADHPFRGECGEGAISYEHMRDTVYWLPKIGMNMYMIEGLVPYSYMHKWYGHVGNSILRKKGQITDYAMLEELMEKLMADIRKTGIQLHTIGHGWMFEKLGIHHTHAAQEKSELREEHKQYLAMLNGERGLCRSTFYTHFCYSNPEARKLLVDFCVEYVKERPYVDFLHVWLADSKNNWCECDECMKMSPSDHYVQLLNEIDEALTAIGSKTRIVFILYVETVRPPVKLRIKNPERFVILAAIGLHYETGYINREYTGEIPPYVHNNFTPPDNALRLKWHKDWKAMSGDIPSIIFEYRFYTDMYCDPAFMRVSKEVYRDMRALGSVSFEGCMSDQTHRMYLPTSLPLVMMSETLFDKSLDYDRFCDDFFEGAFGADGKKCREYLEKLSELFCPGNIRTGGKTGVEEDGLETGGSKPKIWINNPEVAEKTKQIPEVLREFLPTIEKNMTQRNACRRKSWVYLYYHYEICSRLWEVIHLGASGNMEGAREKFEGLERYLCRVEEDIHPAFDLFLFCRAIRSKLEMPQYPYYD